MAAVLSERLQQLRSCASREAAEEALAVFAPLANRLGVWSIKAELEDLAFKVRGALMVGACWRIPEKVVSFRRKEGATPDLCRARCTKQTSRRFGTPP